MLGAVATTKTFPLLVDKNYKVLFSASISLTLHTSKSRNCQKKSTPPFCNLNHLRDKKIWQTEVNTFSAFIFIWSWCQILLQNCERCYRADSQCIISVLFGHVFELPSRDQICTYFSNWNCWAELKIFMLYNKKKTY